MNPETRAEAKPSMTSQCPQAKEKPDRESYYREDRSKHRLDQKPSTLLPTLCGSVHVSCLVLFFFVGEGNKA